MAEKHTFQSECKIGAAEKYFTEYKWTLTDWSVLYDSTYKKGIKSNTFELNGTDGYICSLSLYPTTDQPLALTFSDTRNILSMKVTYSINNFGSHDDIYSQPIAKRCILSFANTSLTKDNPRCIHSRKRIKLVSPCADDTLTLVVKIMVIKSIAVTSPSIKKAPTNLATFYNKTHNFSKKTLSNLSAMFYRNTLCDVTFIAEDEKFYAHRVVLAAHSKVFKAMFVSSVKEELEPVIMIGGTGRDVFETFLNYFYGGQVIIPASKVEEMLVVADYYDVTCLKILCEEYMLKCLCEKNVVRYLILADRVGCAALKEKALCLLRTFQTVLERAIVEESPETMTRLKEILSNQAVKNLRAPIEMLAVTFPSPDDH